MTDNTNHLLFARFLADQKAADKTRTQEYFAKRWNVAVSLVNRWASGRRRIGPKHLHVFADLPFTMEEYYASTPPCRDEWTDEQRKKEEATG